MSDEDMAEMPVPKWFSQLNDLNSKLKKYRQLHAQSEVELTAERRKLEIAVAALSAIAQFGDKCSGDSIASNALAKIREAEGAD